MGKNLNELKEIMPSFLYFLTFVVLLLFIVKFDTPISIDMQNVKILPLETGEIKEFQIVASRFAALHEYDNLTYNCLNYSMDLKHITDELGFKTQIMKGCTKNNSCHAWLKLSADFEPITAQFVDYSDKYFNQEVINE